MFCTSGGFDKACRGLCLQRAQQARARLSRLWVLHTPRIIYHPQRAAQRAKRKGYSCSPFLPLNLSIEVKPSVKIVTHSTAATNSALGAISCGLSELWAIVPNSTKAPIIPTKRLLLNSPLSPLNISNSFFICPVPCIFLLVCYFCCARPCFFFWAWVANLPTLCFSPLPFYKPLSFNILFILSVSTIGSPLAGIVVSTPL